MVSETSRSPEGRPDFGTAFSQFHSAVSGIFRGGESVVRRAICCALAEGHLLIEDVPGVGKTTLASAMAQAMGSDWKRIQFTPDLLPSDVTGLSMFNQESRQFEFRPGPVFVNVVLADEINRASPRVQSALLEVMEERTVTVDGTTRPVPRPFMVIATQNPIGMAGTFPLPEAQVDRFMMRLSIGYPDRLAEAQILQDVTRGGVRSSKSSVLGPQIVRSMIKTVEGVTVSDVVIDYVVRLTSASRETPGVRLGCSPRSSVALIRASRAHAAIEGRDFVNIDDVQSMARAVLPHRLVVATSDVDRGRAQEEVVEDLIRRTATPAARVAP